MTIQMIRNAINRADNQLLERIEQESDESKKSTLHEAGHHLQEAIDILDEILG